MPTGALGVEYLTRDAAGMRVAIHDVEVIGAKVDGETRCAHYHGAGDVIAIKFKCCGNWFPCYQCHADLAGHMAMVWPANEYDTDAVLCGSCGLQLSIREYLACNSVCRRCRHQFNPGCATHYYLYFETPPTGNVGGALAPIFRYARRSEHQPSHRGSKAPPTF